MILELRWQTAERLSLRWIENKDRTSALAPPPRDEPQTCAIIAVGGPATIGEPPADILDYISRLDEGISQ